MDPKLLADAVTNFLAPAMPYLVKGGQEVIGKAGKKIGEDGLEIARKLWGKLQPKVDASPQAKDAATDAAADPEDSDTQATLRRQLRKILEGDPGLTAELTRLIEAAGPKTTYQAAVYGNGAIAQGPGAVAAGQNGLAIGGNVQGDLHVGVDRPRKPRGSAEDE